MPSVVPVLGYQMSSDRGFDLQQQQQQWQRQEKHQHQQKAAAEAVATAAVPSCGVMGYQWLTNDRDDCSSKAC